MHVEYCSDLHINNVNGHFYLHLLGSSCPMSLTTTRITEQCQFLSPAISFWRCYVISGAATKLILRRVAGDGDTAMMLVCMRENSARQEMTLIRPVMEPIVCWSAGPTTWFRFASNSMRHLPRTVGEPPRQREPWLYWNMHLSVLPLPYVALPKQKKSHKLLSKGPTRLALQVYCHAQRSLYRGAACACLLYPAGSSGTRALYIFEVGIYDSLWYIFQSSLLSDSARCGTTCWPPCLLVLLSFRVWHFSYPTFLFSTFFCKASIVITGHDVVTWNHAEYEMLGGTGQTSRLSAVRPVHLNTSCHVLAY